MEYPLAFRDSADRIRAPEDGAKHLRLVLGHLSVVGDGTVGDGELVGRAFARLQLQHGDACWK